MKKFLLGLLCLSTMCFAGCSMFHTDKALITVNDQPITQKDYDALFKQQNTAHADLEKNQGLALIIRHNVVSELVIKELIRQEVKAHKIKVSAQEVNKALTDAYSQVGGKDQFNKFLKNVYGITNDEFKKTLKEEIAINKLIDQIAPITGTSDSEAKGFYQKNKDALFNQQKKVRASHILIMANEDDIIKNIVKKNRNISELEASKQADAQMATLQAKANDILKKATADPDSFAKLARQYSEDYQTSKKGGDLGFFSYEEMTRPFSEAAFKTKPSTVCDKVIKTDYGFHIIKVTDRKEAGIVPFDEVKQEIKTKLTQDRRNKAFQAYITSKESKAVIKYKNPSYDPKVIESQLRDVAKNFSQTEVKGLRK